MGPFCCLHVEIAHSLLLPHGGVLGVGEGARPPVAQPRQVVLVLAEVLRVCLHSVRAMLMTDHIPHNLVDDHLQHYNIIYYQPPQTLTHYYRPGMILNIVILLVVNAIIPMLPISPFLAAPLPLLHFALRQPNVYDHMNLTRLHTPEEFKRAFKSSIKVLHPDRGGDQEAFAKVKDLKAIMEKHKDYYDTLNITGVELQNNTPLESIVGVKTLSYYVEAGIYYFVVMLFTLAYTIEQDLKPARKILIPLIAMFGAYEFYIHFNPQITTVIDLLHDKLPIFVQKAILKTMLSTLVALVRAKYIRRDTDEKKLFRDLGKQHTSEEYSQILKGIEKVYQEKLVRKMNYEQSWRAKIKGWISKAVSLFLLGSLVYGFFGGGGSGDEHGEVRGL